MLGKLIKHEFRATGRVMLPLMAAILALSGLCGIGLRLWDNDNAPKLLNMLTGLITVTFFLGLFAIVVIAFVQMIERFYHNLLCDEGYLMFTLPTTPDALIFSKLVVSFVWFVLTGVLCGLTVFIMMSFAASPDAFTNFGSWTVEVSGEVFAYLGDGKAAVGGLHIAAWVLEGIALCFVLTCGICLRFYAAMAIGQSFDNRKKLMSVIFYFVLGFVMKMLLIGAGNLLDVFKLNISYTMNEFSPGVIHLVLIALIVVSAVPAILYYLTTTLMLKKKLNLA